MILFPKCKINIGLNVIEKRSDGYHNIESIFYPINLCDALEIVVYNQKNGNITSSISGIEIQGKLENNLCYKAYNMLHEKFDLPAVNIFLHKTIPMGAGLGGGSSDGAATIVLLNNLFNLHLNTEQLQAFAIQLGSDCAFFIESEPAYVTGRGEILTALPEILKDLFIVLINPGIHINTAEAYTFLQPKKLVFNLQEFIKNNPIEAYKNILKNDFETYAFRHYPAIQNIKEKLYLSGAIYASMSGSGSSVYGIFKNEVDIKNNFPDCFYWSGKL
jgi:4-diphosphocytidyl-2-C-methyl-D-erythritol kinase